MICELTSRLKNGNEEIMDKPIATAFLAGIVAATSRFSNERTTPATMTMASKLMEAGADQQLISSSIPVELDAQLADAGTGMPVQETRVEGKPAEVTEAQAPVESEKVEEPVVETAPIEESDPTKLSVSHDEPAEAKAPEPAQEAPAPVVEMPAPVAAPTPEPIPEPTPEPAPVPLPEPVSIPEPVVKETPAEPDTPEQQLEKIIQTPPTTESSGPLMDELREVAEHNETRLEPDHEIVLEPLSGPDRTPEKDYAKMMEDELSTPAPANAATQAAPSVPSTVEINGIPDINYAAGSDSGQPMAAPVISTEPAPVVSATQPVEAVQVEQAAAPVAPEPAEATVVEPAPVAEPASVAPAPTATPLPMPDVSSEFLPPPPPPFDPNAPVGAVDFSPTAPAPEAPRPPVEPIAPAAPEVPEETEHSYLGQNPAMQDQVYPPASNDPGAFQLPTPTA